MRSSKLPARVEDVAELKEDLTRYKKQAKEMEESADSASKELEHLQNKIATEREEKAAVTLSIMM